MKTRDTGFDLKLCSSQLDPRMTAYVMVFGRRRITKDAEHSGPAYENRQRTKPREREREPRRAFAELWRFEDSAGCHDHAAA
jgi:hypothetical protein